jgi:ABC-type antimicrobial peptide transport system permease subunit
MSLTALLSNKARSFLTMLGIIIGVAAVIIIVAVGAGAQSLIVAQVKSLGTNLVGILPGKAEESGPPASVMGVVITTLTYDDAIALRNKKNVPNIVDAAAYSVSIGTVTWGSVSYDTNLRGTTASYLNVEGGELSEGRFFTEDEEKNLSRVAVLGSKAKTEIFGDSDPVGQRIKIKKHTFEVIGVMKERGKIAFQDYDDQIFLPVKTVQKLLSGVDYLGFIRAKIDNEADIPRAINDIEMTLRERHDIADQSGAGDDFTVQSAAEALDMITTITNALRFFLAAMAALSLLVGGIGIMNIMLVSVTERTREIGLRKAVGANNSNITWQFLLEAVIITSIGGIIGIVGGVVISFLAAIIIRALGYSWEFSISIWSVLLAFFVALAIGLIFGIYPAHKASKLEPVEALRYE